MSLFKGDDDTNGNTTAMPRFLKSSDSLDGSLAEAINAIEPNMLPSKAAPVAGRRAGRGAAAAAGDTNNGNNGSSRNSRSENAGKSSGGMGSLNDLRKGTNIMGSTENVTALLNRADSSHVNLNMDDKQLQDNLSQQQSASQQQQQQQAPPPPPSTRAKSRIKASIDSFLPRFGMGSSKQDATSPSGNGRLDIKTDADGDAQTSATSPSPETLNANSANGPTPSPLAKDDSFVKKSRRISRGAAFALNDDIDDEKEKVRKTTVGSPANAGGGGGRGSTDAGDQVMVVIPDLMDVEDEDTSAVVAAAPAVKNKNVRTIGELENDIAHTDDIASQLQHLSVPGIDLSMLINAALCPPSQLDEPDEPWDWDIVFTQVSSEIRADQGGPVAVPGLSSPAQLSPMAAI